MILEETMKADVESIFGIPKVTFDIPGESQEQACVFVEIQNARSKVSDQKEIHDVQGTIHVFAPNDKMPYGYFAKRIANADSEITSRWFFGNEEPLGTIRNILRRRMDFRFLFDGQHDPSIGNITSIDLELSET